MGSAVARRLARAARARSMGRAELSGRSSRARVRASVIRRVRHPPAARATFHRGVASVWQACALHRVCGTRGMSVVSGLCALQSGTRLFLPFLPWFPDLHTFVLWLRIRLSIPFSRTILHVSLHRYAAVIYISHSQCSPSCIHAQRCTQDAQSGKTATSAALAYITRSKVHTGRLHYRCQHADWW
jgi:hypothetical protein